MKRSTIRRLATLSAWILLATAPQNIMPLIEADPVTIANGRGKGIEVKS